MQHLQKTGRVGAPPVGVPTSRPSLSITRHSILALSFHALTHCPFCNSSIFTNMHIMGGVPPRRQSPVTGSQPPVPNPTDTYTPSVYILPVLSSPLCIRRIAHSSRLGGRQ